MDKRVIVCSGDAGNLPEIYADLLTQFPEKALHSYEHFEYLLRETGYRLMILERETDRKMIGYCLSYSVLGTGLVWLDYIAIRKDFHGQGYGNLLFLALLNGYREFADGLLFPVEKIDPSDPEHSPPQKRRVDFYERLGAKRLAVDFHLPTAQGPCPDTDLFFAPISDRYTLTARKQRDTLKLVNTLIFGDVDLSVQKACEEKTFPTLTDCAGFASIGKPAP